MSDWKNGGVERITEKTRNGKEVWIIKERDKREEWLWSDKNMEQEKHLREREIW